MASSTVALNRGQAVSAGSASNTNQHLKEQPSTRPHSSLGTEDVFHRLYTSATCASSKQRLHSCPHCLKTKIFSTYTPSASSANGAGKASFIYNSNRHYVSMSHMNNYFNSDTHISTNQMRIQPKLSLPNNALTVKNVSPQQLSHDKTPTALLPLRKKSPPQLGTLNCAATPVKAMTEVCPAAATIEEETSFMLANEATLSHNLMNKKVMDWLRHYHQEELPSIAPVT